MRSRRTGPRGWSHRLSAAPFSRGASIGSGCSCRQAPVWSGRHAHAFAPRLLMRALVIGASGQVGAALLDVLRARGHEALGTYANHPAPGLDPLDLTDHAAVARAVAAARPDWVFCPAGLSHVDYSEDHEDEAMAANRDGPAAAARAAAAAGAGFVYYSSDYVFDGFGGPFREDDAPRPLRVYGRSKRDGEQAGMICCRRPGIIRTSVVHCPGRPEKNLGF